MVTTTDLGVIGARLLLDHIPSAHLHSCSDLMDIPLLGVMDRPHLRAVKVPRAVAPGAHTVDEPAAAVAVTDILMDLIHDPHHAVPLARTSRPAGSTWAPS